MARCPVTQLPPDDCPCGTHDNDDTPEPWREVPFQSPGPDAA